MHLATRMLVHPLSDIVDIALHDKKLSAIFAQRLDLQVPMSTTPDFFGVQKENSINARKLYLFPTQSLGLLR